MRESKRGKREKKGERKERKGGGAKLYLEGMNTRRREGRLKRKSRKGSKRNQL